LSEWRALKFDFWRNLRDNSRFSQRQKAFVDDNDDAVVDTILLRFDIVDGFYHNDDDDDDDVVAKQSNNVKQNDGLLLLVKIRC
jgi:hypothetical protein